MKLLFAALVFASMATFAGPTTDKTAATPAKPTTVTDAVAANDKMCLGKMGMEKEMCMKMNTKAMSMCAGKTGAEMQECMQSNMNSMNMCQGKMGRDKESCMMMNSKAMSMCEGKMGPEMHECMRANMKMKK